MAVGWLGSHSSGGILIHCVLPVLQACPVHRSGCDVIASSCIGRIALLHCVLVAVTYRQHVDTAGAFMQGMPAAGGGACNAPLPPACCRERKCAVTIGTVLVPWAGRFQC